MSTASSLSTPKLEYRPGLYFSKYQYKLVLTSEAAVLMSKFVNPIHGLKALANRMEHSNQYDHCDIGEIDRFISWIKKYPEVKTRSEWVFTMYTNDLSSYAAIDFFAINDSVSVYKADPYLVDGIRYFKRKPNHKYRAYTHARKWSREEKLEFRALLLSKPELFPSSALKRWLFDTYYVFSESSHYIEYDDAYMLTWLQMTTGGIFSHSYELRKEGE